jgi:hypothetical protein
MYINKILTNLLLSETDGIDNVGRGPTIPFGCNLKGKNDLRPVATYNEMNRLHRGRHFYGHYQTH